MPYKDERRDFKKYRYMITHNDRPSFQAYCQNWQEVKEASGIPRSALFLILNDKTPRKHIKWNVVRISLEKSNLITAS